jgi:ribosomal protein S6--L-glutamate ligase
LRDLINEIPIIVKPYMGWRGQGVHVVRNEAELAALPVHESPMLIQEYLPGSDEDLRLYIAGERVFAVKKPFSGDSFARPGRSVPVTAELRKIGLSCGAAFGLGLFGVDLIETESGPRVVDVNYFPGFKGIEGASEVVADYVQRCAEGLCEIPAGVDTALETSLARMS